MKIRVNYKKKYNDNIDFQEQYCNVLVFHLVLMQCKNILVSTNNFLLPYNSILNIICLVTIGYFYYKLILNYRLLSNLNHASIFVIIFSMIFIFVTGLFDPSRLGQPVVLKQIRLVIAYCFPLFILMSAIKNTDNLISKFYKMEIYVCYAAIISVPLRLLFPMPSNAIDYSMSLSNNLMVCCIFLIFKFLEKRDRNTLFYILFCIMYIFLAGSRGALVSIFVAIVLSIYLLQLKITRKQAFATFLIICVVVLTSKYIVYALYFLLNSIGLHSRTLWLIQNGIIFTHDSGRSAIYFNTIFPALNQHPIFGLGAFGCESLGVYSHNFYLDVLVNFGYIFGILMLFVLFYLIYKQIRFNKFDSRTKLLIIFAIILFPMGFFDKNIWGTYEFWIILGILTRGNYNLRIGRTYNGKNFKHSCSNKK